MSKAIAARVRDPGAEDDVRQNQNAAAYVAAAATALRPYVSGRCSTCTPNATSEIGRNRRKRSAIRRTSLDHRAPVSSSSAENTTAPTAIPDQNSQLTRNASHAAALTARPPLRS